MQITNGTVTFERTLRPADFESKKASVTLSFAIDVDGNDENESVVIDRIGGLARQSCLGMLGLVEQPPKALPAHELPGAVVPTPPATRTRRAAPAAAPPAEAIAQPAEAPPAASPSADPFAGATAAPDTSAAAPTGTSPSPAPAAVDPRHQTKALQDACAAKVGSITDGDAKQRIIIAVKALRAEFTGDAAKGCEAIPMDRRGDFLAKLAAL